MTKAAHSPSNRPSAGLIRVLLVEDNATDAMVAQDELAHAAGVQFVVERVDRLQAALALASARTFDVVLMDLSLPDSDGLETFARLSAALPGVPVVVLTHRADEELALKVVQAGAQDYLVKGQGEGLMTRAIRYAIERAQSARELRRVKVRLQRVIEATNDGLWDWLDVSKSAVWWSPSYYAQLGYAPAEMEPTIENFRSLVHPDYFRHSTQVVTDALAGNGEVDFEYPLKTKSGEYRWYRAIAKVYREPGAPVRMAGSTRDITDSKRLSEELIRHHNQLEERVEQRTAELHAAQRQAEAANQAKSDFLATMSHEIRTPMHAILGFTHLLRRDAVDLAQVDRLDKIKIASQHLMSLINDILDLSKIEARRMELEHAPFRLGAVFDDVEALLGQLARDKGLTMAVHCEAAALWLQGDAMRLRQALVNYAGNALKFTETGGLSLSAQLVQESHDSVLLRFTVKDTGIGIAQEHLARLFQAFEQGDASTTRNHGGTGLGLVITRRLAQMMGGEAGAQSVLGQGSFFWFTARLQRGHAPAQASAVAVVSDPQAVLRHQYAGAHILLADDDPFNREIAAELFQDAGLQVTTVGNGCEAVDAARTQRYALILMDVQMPAMNGLEATRAIRLLPGWAHAPILAMTANVFLEDRRACLEAGMNDFVSKPIDAKDLYATVLKGLSESSPA